MLTGISRRQFSRGLCACGVAIAHGSTAHAQTEHSGCSVTPGEFKKSVSPTATDFSFTDTSASREGAGERSGTSGNPAFDQALAITLAKLSRTFGVLPSFSFFNEPNNFPNAVASNRVTRSNRPDGSVAYGNALLKKQLSFEQPKIGDVVGTCAHEFGHIVQFKRGSWRELKRISNGSVFRIELHADFLAGYFGGLRKLEKPDFPAADIALGLFNAGDTSYDSLSHHGTPKQRGEAVVQGYKYAVERAATFNEAFEAGLQFAKVQKLQN
jgi:hypothetical protein